MAKNTNAKTSHAKGEDFERLFARYMINELGWTGYIIRPYQKSKSNNRGSEIDIVGERKDKKGEELKRRGWAFLAAFVFLIAFGTFLVLEVDETVGLTLIIVAVLIEVLAVIILEKGKKLHTESVWVECKNRKSKSNYDDMHKSIGQLKEYNATKDRDRRYVAHYFVSASGFTNEALEYASKNNVTCYEYKEEEFKTVTYVKTY